MVGDVFGKIEENVDNFVLAKYLYDRIKSFNEKPDKAKEITYENVMDVLRNVVANE